MRIGLDDSFEFIDEPISKTVALSPRNDSQDSQIPMLFSGVVLTHFIRDELPLIHRAGPLAQKTPDLSAETRAGEGKTAWRDRNETPDHLALVADHARDRPPRRIEYERAQSGAIRSDPPLRPRSMDRDIHRIVSKRLGQGLQEFSAGARIRIRNGFVYHSPVMLTATNLPRVPGVTS